MDYETYFRVVKKHQPKKHCVRNCLLSFLGGGIVGSIAQLFFDLGKNVLNFEVAASYAFAAVVIVFISFLLTVLGVYNNLSQIFKAGLFIPTTGFANSMTSAALEGKAEGPILGVGTRIFSLAGSVITYGVISSILLCLIRFVLDLMGVMPL